MKQTLRSILFFALCIFCPALALADPPEYTGSAFDQIQIVADDGMLFFGVIIAGAIIVTGFFLGRKWLRRVG